MGTGMNNVVYSTLAMPDGELVTVGLFLKAGGNVSAYLARWD